jgi:hypothetical protein
MDRKPLARTKVVKPRQRRKKAVPFDRHASLPRALVEGVFSAVPGTVVYAWRSRAGDWTQWHECEVVRASEHLVELWDRTLGQWFCFDPTAPGAPDVRAG